MTDTPKEATPEVIQKGIEARLERQEKLFEKMVLGLEAIAKGQEVLNERVSRVEKGPVRKEVPPKMDVEHVEGPAEGFNPQENGEEEDDKDNYPSVEAASKPATSWAAKPNTVKPHSMAKAQKPAPKPAPRPVQKAAPQVDVKGLIAKAAKDAADEVNKQWETKIPELIKAHTPMPFGTPMSNEAQLARKDPFAFVRKMVDLDREVCGGGYSVEEGRFGFKTGAGDMNAREKVMREIRKAQE